MKTRHFILAIAILSMAILVASCKKDEDDKIKSYGTATINGNTVTFDKGYLVHDASEFYIGLYSPEIDLFQESGVGDWLTFQIYTGTESFNGGNFTFSEEQTAGTFNNGLLAVNVDWESLTGGQSYEIVGGSLNVTKSGSMYEIDYDVLVQNTAIKNISDTIPMSGSYSGILTYFDILYDK